MLRTYKRVRVSIVILIYVFILIYITKSMDQRQTYELKVGDTFNSWDEFKSYFKKYQNSVKQVFSISGCRTLKDAENTNIACKYDYVRLECKFAPCRHESRGDGVRDNRSAKLDCAAYIRLVLTKNFPRDLQKLLVENLHLNHNGHDGSENFYELLPENRAIGKNPDLTKEMNKMLKLKVPVSSIQDEFSKEHGVELLAKDVQNSKQKLKNKDDDKLSQAIKLLQDTYGANVELICGTISVKGDENKKFLREIFFSTQKMRDAYSAWPQIVFVDGKYNLLKNRMITILMCVQDGEGHTHIIGVGFVVSEDKPTLNNIFQSLKQSNEVASSKTKIFMTDNDLTERSVIKEVFPECLLLICEFHILKIFMRKVTTAAMKIMTAQRYVALDLLDKMVKCNSEEEYNYHYKKFSDEAPAKVQEYFNNNYHPIKKEWVRYYMSAGNCGNYTNNPVESQNARLGKLCPHPTTLVQFIREFFGYQERKYKAMKYGLWRAMYTRPVNGHQSGTVLYLYEKTLTKKAFELVATQYTRRKPMTFYEIYDEKKVCWIRSGYTILKVSVEECDCLNFKSDGLPCRHIFAVRDYFKILLFDRKLCPELQSTLQHTVINHPILQSSAYGVNVRQSCSPLKLRSTPKIKADNFQQRIKIIKVITTSIVNTGALVTGNTFVKRVALLQAIESKWRNNEEVTLKSTAESLLDISNLSITEQEDHNIELDNVDDSIIIPAAVKITGRPSGVNKSTIKLTKKR